MKKKKNRRMRSLSTRIFSKFFGGKVNFFKQPMPWILRRQKKIRSPINRVITFAYVWLQVVDFSECLLVLIRRILDGIALNMPYTSE